VAAVSAVTASARGWVRAAPRWRPWIKAAVGIALLGAIVAVAGAEPFVRGIAAVSPPAIAAAILLAAAATGAAAWRWRVLARRLGLRLGWKESVAAYYRSQFLNSVLPGGVIGDVDRAVSHGRSQEHIAQAARAVAAERAAGQAVQLVLAVAVVASIGFSAYAPAMALMLGVVLVAIGVALASRRARGALHRELVILRGAFATVGTVLRVVAASVVVLAAHVATFLVACAAVGLPASAGELMVAAVIAVLASSIPLSLGGWGPREAAAAFAFGAAGLGAAAGIAAATAYGVLSLIALAPGALVIAASFLRGGEGLAASVRRAAP
jgi:glycosyltransferase 2 family protein